MQTAIYFTEKIDWFHRLKLGEGVLIVKSSLWLYQLNQYTNREAAIFFFQKSFDFFIRVESLFLESKSM